MSPGARRAKVVVFHCDGGSLATPPRPPTCEGVGFVRVLCAGRVSAGDVLRALRSGATGVLLAGCAPGDCRFLHAGENARQVAEDLAPVLETMGLGAERVRFVAVGGGVALEEAAAAFLRRVEDFEVIRPEPSEVLRTSALMHVLPPYSHHGVVQEAALLSHMRHDTPSCPSWAEGSAPGAETLLFACDLPLLDGLIGRHFPTEAQATLRACMDLLWDARVDVSVVPAIPCCGHDFGLAGLDRERAHEARLVRLALEATGARRVVTVLPECEWNLREGFAALEVSLGPEVVSLADLLYERRDHLGFCHPTEGSTGSPDGLAGEEAVALYVGDATVSSRDSASELLVAAGVERAVVLPLEYGSEPGDAHGSAAVKGFVSCDGEARLAQERLLSEVRDRGATTLVTLSATAAIHLRCAQRRGSWRRFGVRVESLFDFLASRLVRRRHTHGRRQAS